MLIESKETVFILEGKCPFIRGRAFRWNSFIGNLNTGIITFRTNSGIIRCVADETFLNYTIKFEIVKN